MNGLLLLHIGCIIINVMAAVSNVVFNQISYVTGIHIIAIAFSIYFFIIISKDNQKIEEDKS
jgi:hypothetical protein